MWLCKWLSGPSQRYSPDNFHLVSDGHRVIAILILPPSLSGLFPALSAGGQDVSRTQSNRSMLDSWKEHILWAVPKHRRTIERRLKRKYGTPGLHMKILLPRTNLRVCNQCGHDHEVGVLCREFLLISDTKGENQLIIISLSANCYMKVKEETEAMQDAIQAELKLDPVDKEVVVLYDGEKDKPSEMWQGKRIVEMQKPRPLWFSKNLTEKTTAPAGVTATEVKPTDLS